MDGIGLLLRAYWEGLYELLVENKETLAEKIATLLETEIKKRGFGGLDEHRCAAYQDACLAFVEERIEAYNPVGLQYLFDRDKLHEAAQLQFELDWFDGRGEYEQLVAKAAGRAHPGMSDEQVREAARGLIREVGAYPDKSIIAGYEADPAPGKLADYIVAQAIEQIIS